MAVDGHMQGSAGMDGVQTRTREEGEGGEGGMMSRGTMIFGFRVKQEGCKTNHGTSHLPLSSARSYQKGEHLFNNAP
jgi:hypothetical protein